MVQECVLYTRQLVLKASIKISQNHFFHNASFGPVFFLIIFAIFQNKELFLPLLDLNTFSNHLFLLAYVRHEFIFPFFIAIQLYFEIIAVPFYFKISTKDFFWRRFLICCNFYIWLLKLNGRLCSYTSKKALYDPYIFNSFKRLYRLIVKFKRAYIRIAFISIFKLFFQEKIISRSRVVMLISLNASLSILNIKSQVLHQTKNMFIYGNSMIANNYSTVKRYILCKLAPLVSMNLFDIKSFSRVNIQHVFQQIFKLSAYIFWQSIG